MKVKVPLMNRTKTSIPFLIHPLPLSAVFLMALNDHFLKYQYPGVITGKLSDFLGCFYFPLFLLAIWTLLEGPSKSKNNSSFKKRLCLCIGLTDLMFLSVKLSPTLNLWIVSAFSQYLFPIRVATDPSDLLAFTMNPLTYWWALRVLNKRD